MQDEIEVSFVPPGYLKHAMVQTVMASIKLRKPSINPMACAAREVILTVGGGIRLQGFHSPQGSKASKGLVILLHGWEGSAESTYMLRTGMYLYEHGYDVFRLNLRDHGRTYHLNEGIFYAALLDEVFEAVSQAAHEYARGPVFLMGFSLGGNFALRIARRLLEEPAFTLDHILAVSPALDPSASTDAIDSNALLRWYFLKKWKRSLQINQDLYPHLYDFSSMLAVDTIRGVTDALIKKSGLYASTEEYFALYTIRKKSLKFVPVPLTIIIAQDDPAIPIEDFYRLELASHSHKIIHTYGGHNGFLSGFSSPAWYEREAVRIFSQAG